MPLLSIIIPVYNTASFLNECLISVVGQSYRNIEIICVDDGSTDHSLQILDEWQHKDNRIIVVHQDNKGLSDARNTGIRLAHGEFIAFVDSDDKVRENIYTESITVMQEHQLDSLIYAFETFPDGKVKTTGFRTGQVMDYHQLFTSFDKIQTRNSLCFSWRFIFKTSIIKKNKIFFDGKIMIGEDMVFNIDVICHSKRIMVSDAPLYLYRKNNDNSLMTMKYKPNLEASYKRMYTTKQAQILKYDLQDSGYPFDLASYTIQNYLRSFINNVYKNPAEINRIAEIKRIYSFDMVNDAFHKIGFRNIGLNWKEYLFFLAQKYHIWNIIIPQYEQMFNA